MKESAIKKKALVILNNQGYTCWCPPKVRYAQNDIFGIFDTICVRSFNDEPFELRSGTETLFVQWTSYSNISARKKKILAFLKENGLELNWQVWGWKQKSPRKGEFVIRQ
jgi:hypothetical protein